MFASRKLREWRAKCSNYRIFLNAYWAYEQISRGPGYSQNTPLTVSSSRFEITERAVAARGTVPPATWVPV